MIRPTTRLLTAALVAAAAIPSLATSAPRALPSIDVPATARYGALEVSTKTALRLGLNCNVIGARVSCYSTQTAALRAGAAATKRTNATCSPPMALYVSTSFTGSFFNLYTQSAWISLANVGFNNVASSWKTGCVGGYLADGSGGAGTRIGLPAGNQQSSLGTFDNLASSALRCPC
jgi:hypothetical protein